MPQDNIQESIIATASKIMPEGAKVVLFGSRARNEASDDSDWDILVLLDKERIDDNDRDNYTYPLWELGWKLDAMIHPIMYTFGEWEKRKSTLFYKNVEKDGIRLC